MIEIEQLYEKAWFAITETCLAMTIFREEVGGWFLVMFVSLLVGKVWGWIGEGRVEVLEQQPPTNPRLFHIRLSASLLISTLFNLHMFNYSIQTVREQAEPNMMVMFAFEFAVLTVTSLSTIARYMISLYEAAVVKEQTRVQLQERRAEIERRRQRQSQIREEQRTAPSDSDSQTINHQSSVGHSVEEDLRLVEEGVDVPGWEGKGRWVFYLDLTTGMNYSSRLTSPLTHKPQTSSSLSSILPSSVSFAYFMGCLYTLFAMWLLPYDHSTKGSLTSSATAMLPGI